MLESKLFGKKLEPFRRVSCESSDTQSNINLNKAFLESFF